MIDISEMDSEDLACAGVRRAFVDDVFIEGVGNLSIERNRALIAAVSAAQQYRRERAQEHAPVSPPPNPLPDTLDKTRPIRLTDAARMFGFKAQTLRREGHRGRLHVTRIGRADYVTPAEIERLVKCPDHKKAPVSGSDQKAAKETESAPQRGSSKMDRFQSAQASALLSVRKLKKRSKTISPESTAPRETARVIPLK